MTVAQCIADIEVADFVALDLEFSGLFLSVERERKPLTIDDYFGKCLESIPKFLPLQLGICCARRRDETGSWEMKTHEFNLWPQERRIFAADMQSLKFLRQHGFDFNKFFEKAHSYSRLQPLGQAPKTKPRLTDASPILDALRQAHRPLVFHNGLLDLLHLYDKFIAKLPDSREAFCADWIKQFPLLFDTRNIAQEGKHQVLKHVGGLSLEELHRHFQTLKDLTLKFTHVGVHANGPAHGSSAKDAQLTAEVFVYEMELWIRHSSQTSRKRRRLDSENGMARGAEDGWNTVRRKKPEVVADVDPSTEGLWSATLLQTNKACKRFHNVVAIVGASPGQLHLGKPAGSVLPVPSPTATRTPAASQVRPPVGKVPEVTTSSGAKAVSVPAAPAEVESKTPASAPVCDAKRTAPVEPQETPVSAPEGDAKATAPVEPEAKTPVSAPEGDAKATAHLEPEVKTPLPAPEVVDDAASGECADDDPYTAV